MPGRWFDVRKLAPPFSILFSFFFFFFEKFFGERIISVSGEEEHVEENGRMGRGKIGWRNRIKEGGHKKYEKSEFSFAPGYISPD